MNNVVIRVENLGKLYRLGEIGTGTLSHDLNRWWARVRGKEDPFSKIGEVNDRTSAGESEYVWALKNVNFDVKRGEVLGIIGRNGAGKSTLLKLLSKVTIPTSGKIKVKGRIASLLEVGTGFHPELTGRENIFLNGAILGMTKSEIKRKFEEIVEFAGVERYIDTPVKRYSSGMYVRLAFSVAAFLEPEILIVDEVLAVGDAEFQKKCLGRMQDVSKNDGRTVLFVSHNLSAVQNICGRALLLNQGRIELNGSTHYVIQEYLQKQINNQTQKVWGDSNTAPGNEKVRLYTVKVKNYSEEQSAYFINQPIEIELEYEIFKKMSLNITLIFYTQNEDHLLSSVSLNQNGENYKLEPGKYKAICQIPENFFNEGHYYVSVLFVENYSTAVINLDHLLTIEFQDHAESRGNYFGKWGGVVRPRWKWENTKNINNL